MSDGKKQLEFFLDKQGDEVYRGDTVAYAVDNYGSTRLKIGVVKGIYLGETGSPWSSREVTKVVVQVPGHRMSTVENLHNMVLLERRSDD